MASLGLWKGEQGTGLGVTNWWERVAACSYGPRWNQGQTRDETMYTWRPLEESLSPLEEGWYKEVKNKNSYVMKIPYLNGYGIRYQLSIVTVSKYLVFTKSWGSH